jgi:phage tail sheath gpL-like
MPLNDTSLAAAVGVAAKNVQFIPAAENVPRKILVIGTYDPLKILVVDEVPVQVFSPEDAGDKFGFGFMIHRLVTQVFTGSDGVECWVIPQTETSAQSAGSHTFTAVGVKAGTMHMYIAGIYVPFAVEDGDDATALAAAADAAIAAIKELPVTSIPTIGVLDVTSKSEGLWGNDISLTFNERPGEEFPVGVSVVTVDMASGAGTPTIADALDGLGTGDNANEAFFTDVVHGYGQETTTLDAISTYVGPGNDFLGLYSKTVARPFRVLTGDVATGSAGLTALIALGDGRKTDRASGVIAVPASPNHPAEIAAQTIGHMARINNDRSAQHYLGVPLIDILPGATADRWTSEYDNRDNAVKAGISPTKIQSGVVTLQNVVTFYHPDNVPVSSNGYRSMRNISILQNILDSIRVNFEQEKWQGVSIVSDTRNVSNTRDRQKARDVDSVIDDLVALARAFEQRAWIFDAQFTIDALKVAGAVSVRSGANGFNSTLSIILSGESSIFDTLIEFDTSIAVLL